MRTKYNLSYYHERRYFLIQLLGGKCAKCGSVWNLEFDHIDKKTKTYSISKIWSYSIQKVLAEIAKCQLLCEECHKKKNETYNGKARHGTISMHRHHKCRCRPCMDAYNEARKRWRKPKQEIGG